MRRTTRAPAATAGLLALLVLSGCGSTDDPVVTTEQKQSADAKAPTTAPAGERERFLPLLRKYHDQATWPLGYDVTPEQIWDRVAASSGDLVLDDTVAAGDIAIVNQCAWTLKAIDTVKADQDTADVRRGLVRSSELVPGGGSFFQEIADQVALGNTEKAQQFVTANTCHEDFD